MKVETENKIYYIPEELVNMIRKSFKDPESYIYAMDNERNLILVYKEEFNYLDKKLTAFIIDKENPHLSEVSIIRKKTSEFSLSEKLASIHHYLKEDVLPSEEFINKRFKSLKWLRDEITDVVFEEDYFI